MNAALESFLAGVPFLLGHFAVTLAMLAIGVALYMRITPHDEMRLIRDDNSAAAISLGGAMLGLAIPLAVCMANSVNVFDIIIWGVVTLVIQLITFRVIDAWLKDLPRRIEEGSLAAAILLASIKLAVAAINAPAVSG